MVFKIDDRGNCIETHNTNFISAFISALVVLMIGMVLLPRIARKVEEEQIKARIRRDYG